jgi:hypothetical protein
MIKTLRPALFLALVTAACGASSEPDTTTPPTNAHDQVEISIASVTLADDCGGGPSAGFAQPPAAEHEGPSQGAAMKSQAISAGDRACEQSSIQLRIANPTDEASSIAIQTIEVIDASGARVAELTSRAPSRWVDSAYQAWDEQIAPNQVLQVSYALSTPYLARGASYTVKVTLATGDDQRTLEQKTTLQAEASLPPDAVT